MVSLLPELSEIRTLRVSLGMSQKELSRRSGVSQAAISKAERGRGDVSYSSAFRIFSALESSKEETKGGNVESYMKRGIFSAETGDLAEKAIKIMRERGISQLPVFSGGRSVGSVSERTLLEASGRLGMKRLLETRVSSIMQAPFPIVPEGTGIDAASDFLSRFSAILVSDKTGKISGILTRTDLLRGAKK